jgi:uncharacterized protein (TIGR02147 family)
MGNEGALYRERIQEELARRYEKNPRYSIRAFARSMDLDPTALSRVIAGKQIPSLKLAEKILGHLDLSPAERGRFLASLSAKQRARGLKRLSRLFSARGAGSAPKAPAPLALDLYRVIGDWYHMAILVLTQVRGFEDQPQWIGSQLGISTTEAALAVERLLKVGLLVRDEASGRLKMSAEQLATSDKGLTTAAQRKNQKQFLEKAIHSLENDPISERSITSMTMAIDPEKLVEAKPLISQFNQALCRFLESGTKSRVYNLEIALYPLQKGKDRRK